MSCEYCRGMINGSEEYCNTLIAYRKGKEDERTIQQIECADCARQFAKADEERIRADERRKIVAKIEGYLAVKYGDGTLEQQFTSMEIIDYIKTLLKVGEQK